MITMQRIARLACALVIAPVMLTAATMCAGAAEADANQDHFVALLGQEQVPPMSDGDIPALVNRAHQMCAELNGGTSGDALVDDEMNRAFGDNPALHLYAGRVRRTAVRFVIAAVDVYCPSHHSELPPYE
jgi:hypothetical protein